MSKFKNILNNKTLIIMLAITIIRFLMSFNLPVFYIKNLPLDDYLMIELQENIVDGNYLGNYNEKTLIKGLSYPLFLAICNKFNLSYPLILTLLYILSCIYLTTALNKNIKNKKWLIILYLLLLFNPISYSMEVFQRIYRNALSPFETLFFIGTIIRIINTNKIKSNIFYYIILGLITTMMLLTREDSIWTIIIIIMLIIYKIFKNFDKKNFFVSLTPIITITVFLNIISLINYHYYKTFTYNEINNSAFSLAYAKIQEIKDDNKKSRHSIPKSTLYKLSEVSTYFDFSYDQIDELYKNWGNSLDTMDNGTIIWGFRDFIYKHKSFVNGQDANKYFNSLATEIEELFKNKKLKRELIIPSVLINTPTISDIKKLPSDFIKTLKYVSTYKNVRTANKENLVKFHNIDYNYNLNFYYIYTKDYHNTENVIKKNIDFFNNINNIYKYFTIIFSIISLPIFIINLKKIKKENVFIVLLIFMSYLIIISGVTYTHTTAFHAIRYFYLSPAYFLQNIFIVMTLQLIDYKKIKSIILKKVKA